MDPEALLFLMFPKNLRVPGFLEVLADPVGQLCPKSRSILQALAAPVARSVPVVPEAQLFPKFRSSRWCRWCLNCRSGPAGPADLEVPVGRWIPGDLRALAVPVAPVRRKSHWIR